MKRLLLFCGGLLLTLALAACGDTDSDPTSGPPASPEYKTGDRLTPSPAAPAEKAGEIAWDDLLPKNWDPLSSVKGLKLDTLEDSDPRAIAAMEKLRAAWDDAPANPDIAGKAIRIPGFMVPLEYGQETLTEFLLVPYFGACIHVPPPPANQVIHVLPGTPARMQTYMDAVWVEGVIELTSSKTGMGNASYRIRAARVRPFTIEDRDESGALPRTDF
jgi:hypothetical protein